MITQISQLKIVPIYRHGCCSCDGTDQEYYYPFTPLQYNMSNPSETTAAPEVLKEEEHHHDHCDCGHDHHHDKDACVEPVDLGDGTYDVYPSDPKKIVKKVLVKGSGDRPTKNCQVSVHYVGTLLNGEKFDSSVDRNQQFEFKLGVGSVIKGWDLGVASMQIGEKSLFTIAPEYAYGANGAPPKIPPNATLNFEIELFSFYKEPTTTEEKMAFGQERKDAGNAFVKSGEYEKAKQEYQRGLDMVQWLYCEGEEQKNKHIELVKALHLNKGLCCLKTQDYLGCVQENDEVLKFQRDHVKAIFRRASALRLMNELDPAMQDLAWCAKQQPNDKAIRAEFELVKAAYKKKQQKERQVFGGLFEKMQKMEEEEEKEKKERDAKEETEKTQVEKEKESSEKKEEKPAEEKDKEAEESKETKKEE